MLQFLVTSKARRRLLEMLWGDSMAGNAAELAAQAGLGFATVHAELKAMRQFGLVQINRIGRRDVYAANGSHPAADLLRSLVRVPNDGWTPSTERDEDVRGWLRELGVPLRGGLSQSPAPDLSDVLLEGVRLARTDPTVARALPLAFWNARGELDVSRLLKRATRPEEKHALGFYLELTGHLAKDRRLVALAKAFRDKRLTTPRDFFLLPPTPSRRKLAEARTPNVARRWGFRMNMEAEAFSDLFDKFRGTYDK